MRRSTDFILTTHGGNLPRPQALDRLLARAGEFRTEIETELPQAVQWVVDRQIACGLDLINDGEYVKAANGGAYTNYVASRVQGFSTRDRPDGLAPKRAFTAERDRRDFPGFYESGLWFTGSGGPVRPGFATPGRKPEESPTEGICAAPLEYVGHAAIDSDIAALKRAIADKPDSSGFIAALGPLSLGAAKRNLYYRNEQEYMFAVAEAMRVEYKAITDAGLYLQVDEPEFATSWMFYPDWSVADYRKYLAFCVDVINHALAGIPEEMVRFHMCWGSGHRPHTNDIGLEHIVDLMFQIKAQAYSFEASNVRHAHEYQVFRDHKLPDGKIIVPGVVGHYTDLVEHPELVAERLVNFANIVGMENLHGGTDCGIGSRVGHEEIAWAKLEALAEGARIASRRLKS